MRARVVDDDVTSSKIIKRFIKKNRITIRPRADTDDVIDAYVAMTSLIELN